MYKQIYVYIKMQKKEDKYLQVKKSTGTIMKVHLHNIR